MTAVLRLEPPFYLPEAVEQFIRPLFPDATVIEIPVAALSHSEICEALNAALRLSIERAV